jgi:cytochrome P450
MGETLVVDEHGLQPRRLDMSLADAVVEYDPVAYYEDPYPIYRALRDAAPVYCNDSRGVWVLSRYADVQAAASDPQTFSSRRGTDITDFSFGPGDFLDQDPPRHDELRKILRPDFLPKQLKTHEDKVRSVVELLLDDLIARGGGDFASEFAQQIPLRMICHLLGVPDADRPLMEGWFVRIVERVPGEAGEPEDVAVASGEMEGYVEAAVAERAARPRDDVFSRLARAVADGDLQPDEIFGMTRLLLIAGIHTTSSLLANALLLLRDRPADRERLASSPETIRPAIEELLRFDAPVQWLARLTTRDVAVNETVIPADQRVVLLWASANRDDRRYPDADTLDLTREPEHHMAFGQGIHFCLGAPLARLEARIALEILFQRVRVYELAGSVGRLFTHNERGIASLPLKIRS